MSHGIGAIQVKRERGVLVVQGLGRTPRGQKYIKATIPIAAPKMSDKNFKSEMTAAVTEMMAQKVLPL